MVNSISKNMTWRAIPVAGLAAGSVFLITMILLSPGELDVDPSLFLQYIAALVMGSSVLTDNSTGVLVVGVVVHYALSILFALVVAIVIHRWGLRVGIAGGAIMGMALYGINIYTMTVFFKWFFAINSGILALSHALFGAVAGGVYEMFDHYDLTFDSEITYETA